MSLLPPPIITRNHEFARRPWWEQQRGDQGPPSPCFPCRSGSCNPSPAVDVQQDQPAALLTCRPATAHAPLPQAASARRSSSSMALSLLLRCPAVVLLCLVAAAAADRRFSDFKRCADEECSMLLCRGKAAKDFTGPDCRFLTFKKGETIYVYYKLAGRRSDLWAGSVGSAFGYFPKDLLTINHIYTEKEVEAPAEETDFVCFDTGLDKFDNYDVDSLLATAALSMESENSAETTSVNEREDEEIQLDGEEGGDLEFAPADEDLTSSKDSESLSKDAVEGFESEIPKEDMTEDKDLDDPASRGLPQTSLVKPAEILEAEEIEYETQTEVPTENANDDLKGDKSVDSGIPVANDTPLEVHIEGRENFSEGRIIPKVKTTFGSTYDAVTTDDENTWKVTPKYDEKENQELEDQPNNDADSKEIPLLSFTEENNSHPDKNILQASPSEEDNYFETEPFEGWEDSSDVKDESSVLTNTDEDTDFAAVNGDEGASSEENIEEDIGEKQFHRAVPENADISEEKNIPPVASEPDQEPTVTVRGEISDGSIGSMTNNDVHQLSNSTLPERETDESDLEWTDKNNETFSTSELPVVDTEIAQESLDIVEDVSFEKVAEHSPKELSADGIPEGETAESSGETSNDYPEYTDISEEENGTLDVSVGEPSALAGGKSLGDRYEDAAELKKDAAPDLEADEQVRRVKKEITDLFKQTLEKENDQTETENPEPSDHLEQEEADQDVGLLEDENAQMSKVFKQEHLDSNDQDPSILQRDNEQEDVEIHSRQEVLELEESMAATGTEAADETGTNSSQVSSVDSNLVPEDTEIEKDVVSADFDKVHLSSSEPEGEGKGVSSEADVQTEMEFGDCVQQLVLIPNHFKNEDLERLYKHLGPQNLLRVETMLIDLDQELRAARLSEVGTSEDIEKSLEGILEASETSILDEIERMLDAQEQKRADQPQMDRNMFDEEANIQDNIQELAFQLRQKYSTASDSSPVASDKQNAMDSGEREIAEAVEDTSENITSMSTDAEEEEEAKNVDLRVSGTMDSSLDSGSDGSFEDDGGHFNKNKDVQGYEDDGGHFNKNKDVQGYEDSGEIQRGPQAILENPADMGFGFDVKNPSSGSDSPSISDYHEEEPRSEALRSGFFDFGNTLILTQGYLDTYAANIIASLPEEWQPGPTFHGFSWQPVVATAAVGILTFLVFTWRTVLAVKSRTYQLTEKQLADRIKQLLDEKSGALSRVSELRQKITENEAKLKESEESVSASRRENKELKKSVKELQKRSADMTEKIGSLTRAVEEERKRSEQQGDLIAQTEKTVEKFKGIVKSSKEELEKVQALMDEAKIKEDALKAQVMAFEKENTTLKDQKKSLLRDAKGWEEKHRDLNEKIRLLQKSQKELEDTLAHKENEIEVLSDCITELRELDVGENEELQLLANGEAADKKSDALKRRIKQMMDVSRVRTALSLVEEERDAYLAKLLGAEKQRHELEAQTETLECERASLASEKHQLEDQLKTIQQKLEIMSELHQQKETALQQKLTQEEFQRREKESRLSEVDGRAVQAEEELRAHKRRIQEVEEELQKTERSYKAQIAAHEKKAHENWLNARASERALVEEKRETANLRQKLVEVNDKLAEFQRPLFKPTPGRSERQVPALPRRGDSYGPSPVSGGAPSPPMMIEGPGRPPSAPVGRRGDPFGSRTSEPHGRYSELGRPLPDRPGPRTSSPGMDGSSGSVQSEAHSSSPASGDTTEPMSSRSQGQPSFLESPIREAPVPGLQLPCPPKGHGPPNGPLPPMPRLPNGHLPLLPPGLPLAVMGPGPYGPPGPPRHYGPVPPFVRGLPPPLREYPPGPAPLGAPLRPEIRHPVDGPRDYPLPPGAVLPPRPVPAVSRDYPTQPEGHRDASAPSLSGP